MADIREAVLAQLLVIAEGLKTSGDVKTAKRNSTQVAEETRPAILIFDADEAADAADPQTRSGPRRVAMSPETYLLLGGKPENVGAAINALRAKWIKAVLTDATLKTILGSPTGLARYEGCGTSLAMGKDMNADMGVSFSFHYVLDPGSL